jgi:hypothetical protein
MDQLEPPVLREQQETLDRQEVREQLELQAIPAQPAQVVRREMLEIVVLLGQVVRREMLDPQELPVQLV